MKQPLKNFLPFFLLVIPIFTATKRFYMGKGNIGTIEIMCFYVMVGALALLIVLPLGRDWWRWLKDPFKVCPLCRTRLDEKGYDVEWKSEEVASVLCKNCKRTYEVRRYRGW